MMMMFRPKRWCSAQRTWYPPLSIITIIQIITCQKVIFISFFRYVYWFCRFKMGTEMYRITILQLAHIYASVFGKKILSNILFRESSVATWKSFAKWNQSFNKITLVVSIFIPLQPFYGFAAFSCNYKANKKYQKFFPITKIKSIFWTG